MESFFHELTTNILVRGYTHGYDIYFLTKEDDFRDYFIGLWIADGYQSTSTKKIRLTNSNKHLIDQVVKHTKYTNSIITQRIEGEKTKYHLDYASPIYYSLCDLGYNFGAKTGKEFIPDQIYNFASFLRGYFDGDGCFSVKKRRKGHIHASIGCANKQFLESVLVRLRKENIVIGGSISKRKDIGFYTLIFGHTDAIKLGYYMYHEGMTVKLDYKYYLWREYKETEVIEYDKNRVCSIDGCNKPHRGRGLCHTHYNQEYFIKPRSEKRKLKRFGRLLNKLMYNKKEVLDISIFENALYKVKYCIPYRERIIT